MSCATADTIPSGTKVRLRTINGGDVVCELASGYEPTYGCWFKLYDTDGMPMKRSFCRNGWEIVSVEVVT